MLTRNKTYERIEPSKEAKKIIIFCEGDKEVNYFKYFQGFSSNLDIIPIPNVNSRSGPNHLYSNAIDKVFGTKYIKPILTFDPSIGDEIWFAIDTDRWNEQNHIEQLKTNCRNHNNWFVAQSNPCFEIWLYFHFHSVKPIENEVNQHLTIKEYLNNKIAGGFNTKSHPILFQTAMQNSESNFELNGTQPNLYSTEVFKLSKSILPFLKEAIDKCLQNLNR